STPVQLPQTIMLPNQTSYSFSYYQGQGGEIQSITLPTGAQISYAYGNWLPGGRPVTSRTVTVGGVSSTWTYTEGGTLNTPTVTVTDAANNDTVYTCTNLGTTPGPFSCDLVTNTQYFNGTGANRTLLKSLQTDYQSFFSWQSAQVATYIPIRETTTWV